MKKTWFARFWAELTRVAPYLFRQYQENVIVNKWPLIVLVVFITGMMLVR